MTYRRTLRIHKKTAIRTSHTEESLRNLAAEIHGRFPIAHPVNRAIVNLQNTLSKMRTALDDDYQDIRESDDPESMYFPPVLERQDAVGIVDEGDSDTEEEGEPPSSRGDILATIRKRVQ